MKAELKGRIRGDILTTKENRQIISFELNDDFKQWYDEFNGKDLEITVKPWREKRSLNANDYFWKLCTMLSETMNIDKNELYRDYIKKMGVYKEFHDMSPEDAKTLQTAWGMLGIGWVTEQVDYEPDGEHVIIRCYYGSSKYSTKRMSRLIDMVVQDCKAVGIPTETPNQIAEMLSRWGEQCDTQTA